MSRYLAVASVVIGVLFAISAALQLNDPDPMAWTVLYLAASTVCIVAPRDPARIRWMALLVGGVAAVWGILIASQGLGPVTAGELVGDMEMKSANTEAWREALGLAMVASWCLVLFRVSLRGKG